MMTSHADKKREQVQMFCMDDMVPKDHLLRMVESAIDWSFIYDLVVERYSPDQGRPSMDPVTLIKISFIQYLYGIRSMRQTIKEIKCSTTDPDSGWFHKGEHKQVFVYAIQTACDKHGWVLDYTVNPGNIHDSRSFIGLYEKIKDIGIERLIADAGYKNSAIAKLLNRRWNNTGFSLP